MGRHGRTERFAALLAGLLRGGYILAASSGPDPTASASEGPPEPERVTISAGGIPTTLEGLGATGP